VRIYFYYRKKAINPTSFYIYSKLFFDGSFLPLPLGFLGGREELGKVRGGSE